MLILLDRLKQACRGAAAFGLMTLAPAAALAQSPENFQVRTTQDLIALCGASPSSAQYAEAISFCHGFAVGAFQYYSRVSGASRADKFVCLPDPPPSRTQAIADFVAWTQAHPEVMSAAPVDSMFRHLGERYPCRS